MFARKGLINEQYVEKENNNAEERCYFVYIKRFKVDKYIIMRFTLSLHEFPRITMCCKTKDAFLSTLEKLY